MFMKYGSSRLIIIIPTTSGFLYFVTIRLQMISQQNICYRKQAIKHWLNSIICKNNQLTALDVARNFYLALLESEKIKKSRNPDDTKNTNKRKPQIDQSNAIEQLWSGNQYFYQSLIDFSEDLLYYTYSSNSCLRNKIPKCLVGYYQIAKNIAYYNEFETGNDGLVKQEKSQYDIPKSVKQFCREKINSLLFGFIPVNQLRGILTKFSDSLVIKQFQSEIEKSILLRVQYFQEIYGLQFKVEAKKFIKLTLFSQPQYKSQTKELPLDQVLLCLLYLIFKVNKQTIIFSKIISIYEEKTMTLVNKQLLLDYFNTIFLAEWHQKMKTPLIKNVKIEKQITSKITGDQIKQQKSIFDMFNQ